VKQREGERGAGARPEAYEAGVRLLAPRALSAHEVRSRLGRRGYPADEIGAAIEALSARGFLDDRALAYNVATTLAERRLFGKSRVAAELARRGVAAEAIGEALERAFAGLDEDAMARKAAGRRAGADPNDKRARERTARSLLRRGFSRGAVARALGGTIAEADAGAGEDSADIEESEDLRHDHDFERDP
jgi:regulatory protein